MKIKYGDMFKLGEHYLINGDCRDPKIIKKLVGNNKIKVILCDVPYGTSAVESKQDFGDITTDHRVILNDQKQTDEEYAKFTRNWLEVVKPFLERKNSAYLFNCDKMIFALRDGFLQAGFKYSQLLIWVKSHPVIGRLNYLPQHELILYGWFGVHEFRKSQDKSVLFFPKPNKSKLHPTMKPIPLIRNLILNSSDVGDYIFDGFLGSGTTILSAEMVKRKCLGVELDPEYCKTIINRFEKAFNIKTIKL